MSNIDFDFGSPNRFDLEMAIVTNMNVADNLNTIIEDIVEGDGFMNDKDQLVNTLQGIINLHTINHGKLWTTFVKLFQLDGHGNKLYDMNEEENTHHD